jgi:hypothetical protein
VEVGDALASWAVPKGPSTDPAEKLRGTWVFEHARVGGQEEHWLLIKADDDDDARRNPTSTEPRSVLSGRTVAAVSDEHADDADDG